jgi:hypothetical protein
MSQDKTSLKPGSVSLAEVAGSRSAALITSTPSDSVTIKEPSLNFEASQI